MVSRNLVPSGDACQQFRALRTQAHNFAPFNQSKDYAHFDDSLPTAMAKESKAYRTLLDPNWGYTVSHTMLNLQEVY
ncbi:MAG: hypothetical protein ACK4QL_04290 [Pseudanabaenaceae cyanobacterium]